MKSIILTFILLTGFSSVWAQSATTSFDVSEIKVIFKPTTKNVIDVRLYFRGGVTNYPKGQDGLEAMTLNSVMQCGNQKYKAIPFRDSASKYNIELNGVAAYDYGYLEMNCITKYFDKGWELFSNAVMNPTFEANELALLKNKAIAARRRSFSLPESRLEELQMQNAFANTAYSSNPWGIEETLTKFTPDDLKGHYSTILNKSRIFIVIVGNVDKQEIYEKIISAFSAIPSAPYSRPDLTPPMFNDNKLITEQRDLKINYIAAVMNAPEFTSMDYVPFRLAVSGLGGNIYMQLRSIHNLSANPSVGLNALKMPFVSMTASTSNPQEAMQVMVKTLKDIQVGGYDDEWLQHLKNGYVTNSYISEQSTPQLAYSLGQAEILGNWKYAENLPQLVNMVTVEQVNHAINSYITGIKWFYMGNLGSIEGFRPPAF